MNIYFSGIGGVGLGPLAEVARDAGHAVLGSDMHEGLVTAELTKAGVPVSTDQSGAFLQQNHAVTPIDRFIYTAALPADHPELLTAQRLGIPTAKRDELLVEIVREKHLKLIAVAGTHGKTSTTGMMVWVMQQLGVPVSYSVGTTLPFGPSGRYDPHSEYFVYECDEYDRNFLHFSPYVALLPSIGYDHPDTYPTQADYTAAFNQFLAQTRHAVMWHRDTLMHINPPASATVLHDDEVENFEIAGAHNRANATLVAKACEHLGIGDPATVRSAIESFPGVSRRFERLSDSLFSDYGHHPSEIRATLQMARELSAHVVLVYQPHQNTRQHKVRGAYTSCMKDAEKIYWLPTYLSREDPNLPVLTPQELTERLANKEAVTYTQLDDTLWQAISEHRANGHLVLFMGAGDIDAWARTRIQQAAR